MEGSRYTLQIQVTGDAAEHIQRIHDALVKLNEEAGKGVAEAAASGSKALVEHLTVMRSAAASALQDVSNQVEKWGAKLTSYGREVFGFYSGLKEKILSDTREMGSYQSALATAFGNEWSATYEKLINEMDALTWSVGETMTTAAMLGRMGIDPFGGALESQQEFIGKNGQVVRALETLNDVTTVTKHSVYTLQRGLLMALNSDKWMILQRTLGVSASTVEKWRDEQSKLNTQQERYNHLIGEMAKLFGGATAARASGYSAIVGQIPDLILRIRSAVGRDGLKVLTSAMNSFVESLKKLAGDKDALNALSRAFTFFMLVITLTTRATAVLIDVFRRLVSGIPFLTEAVIILSVLAAGAAVATGFVLGLAAAFLALAGAVLLIGWKLLLASLGAAIVLFPVVIAAVVAAAAAGLLFVGVLNTIAGAFTSKGKDAMSVAEKMNAAFTALKELISSYDGMTGRMSTETAKKLEKSGLQKFVVDLFNFYHKVSSAWRAFKAGLDDMVEVLRPVAVPLVKEMKQAIIELMDAFGLSTIAQKANNSTTNDWVEIAKGMVKIITEIIRGILIMMRFAVATFRLLLEWRVFHIILGVIVALITFLCVTLAFSLMPLLLAIVAITVVWVTLVILLAIPFLAVGAIVVGIVKGLERIAELLGIIQKKDTPVLIEKYEDTKEEAEERLRSRAKEAGYSGPADDLEEMAMWFQYARDGRNPEVRHKKRERGLPLDKMYVADVAGYLSKYKQQGGASAEKDIATISGMGAGDIAATLGSSESSQVKNLLEKLHQLMEKERNISLNIDGVELHNALRMAGYRESGG